ncbi:uncharacterized protein RAG0_12442 [Rhynchosporium agropyri]|uniref:Uncharacterized protein n=1 Tax=Rhynchosporium agropyri TaxID=914238 RepID=A0A1E1L8C0_9HELO|nr:uncharacterized protein RAG0_12442 [Rhynchosporium agropyri]
MRLGSVMLAPSEYENDTWPYYRFTTCSIQGSNANGLGNPTQDCKRFCFCQQHVVKEAGQADRPLDGRQVQVRPKALVDRNCVQNLRRRKGISLKEKKPPPKKRNPEFQARNGTYM